jgi:hypothetical protein
MIPVAKRLRALVCGRSLAEIVGLHPAEGVDVSCEYCVLYYMLRIDSFNL